MFLDEGKTTINLDISVENDLEVDADGNFHLVTLLFVEDHDDPNEIRINFEEVVENVIDFYRDDPSSNIGYGQMYSIANEFIRHATRLREVAGYMEDKTVMGDLFDEDESITDPDY
jgi:hypothetical protein